MCFRIGFQEFRHLWCAFTCEFVCNLKGYSEKIQVDCLNKPDVDFLEIEPV